MKRKNSRPGNTTTQGVSIDAQLLAASKLRAEQRGLNWSEHITDLIKRDLARAAGEQTIDSLAEKVQHLEQIVQELPGTYTRKPHG